MEKKEFDKKVQDLMAGFKEEYDPNSWNSFEKKLQFEEEMDELIKQSMESYEEPFNEEHWEILTQEIHRRKVRNIVKRTSEVIIILLLIMTTHNLLQFKSDKNDRSRDYIHLTALEDSYPQISNHIDFASIKNEVSLESSDPNSAISGTFSAEEYDHGNPRDIIMTSKSDVPNYAKSRLRKQGFTGIQQGSSKTEVIPQYSALTSLKINPLNIESNPTDAPNMVFLLADSRNENGLWLSFVAGPDVNFVNSPFDLNLLKSPIQSQSGTMTFGATISKDIGLFEITTGLLYSSKNYFPFRIREFVPSINQRYLETSLRSLEFDQIQIPLLVNLHTRRSSGWSMYGTLGLGVNVIVDTKYDIETQVRSFLAAPTSSTGVERLNLSELPRGAFQSGTFGNNVFASAIAGFGIEKRINNMYGFTLLTTYQRSLSKEINPVINRTQQLSMSLGVKVNLR
jgi:hypothetical protein